jgi:sulfite reductase alpha subunit-like flavoprotein
VRTAFQKEKATITQILKNDYSHGNRALLSLSFFSIDIIKVDLNKPHEPKFTIKFLPKEYSGPLKLYHGEISTGSSQDSKNPYYAPLASRINLFQESADHFQSPKNCTVTPREEEYLEVDLSSVDATYQTGDHIVMHPSNHASLVEKLLFY